MAKAKQTKVMAPADDSGASDSDTATESKRKQVSKRWYIDSKGEEVERIEEATGAAYQLLGDDGETFKEQFGEPGLFTTMCGIFGFHTKAGNVANTTLNDKQNPGTVADAAADIDGWISKAKDEKVWAERTGGIGVKIDKDALAWAVGDAIEAKNASDGGKREFAYDKVRERLESDAAYLKTVRAVPEVAAAYAKRVGRTTKTVDDILAA